MFALRQFLCVNSPRRHARNRALCALFFVALSLVYCCRANGQTMAFSTQSLGFDTFASDEDMSFNSAPTPAKLLNSAPDVNLSGLEAPPVRRHVKVAERPRYDTLIIPKEPKRPSEVYIHETRGFFGGLYDRAPKTGATPARHSTENARANSSAEGTSTAQESVQPAPQTTTNSATSNLQTSPQVAVSPTAEGNSSANAQDSSGSTLFKPFSFLNRHEEIEQDPPFEPPVMPKVTASVEHNLAQPTVASDSSSNTTTVVLPPVHVTSENVASQVARANNTPSESLDVYAFGATETPYASQLAYQSDTLEGRTTVAVQDMTSAVMVGSVPSAFSLESANVAPDNVAERITNLGREALSIDESPLNTAPSPGDATLDFDATPSTDLAQILDAQVAELELENEQDENEPLFTAWNNGLERTNSMPGRVRAFPTERHVSRAYAQELPKDANAFREERMTQNAATPTQAAVFGQYAEPSQDTLNSFIPKRSDEASQTSLNAETLYENPIQADVASRPNSARSQQSLDLEDVNEFSHQADANSDLIDDALLTDASAEETDVYVVDFDEIADEAFAALDPYSSLFIKFEPTASWTEAVLEYVEEILNALPTDPKRAQSLLVDFRAKINDADALRPALEQVDRTRPLARLLDKSEEEKPELITRYSPDQRVELLGAFKNALERRAFVWKHTAEFYLAKHNNALTASEPLTDQELALILSMTEDVKRFFGDSQNGRNWRESFDVDTLIEDVKSVIEIPSLTRFNEQTTDSDASHASVGYIAANTHASTADAFLDAASLENARDATSPQDLMNAAQVERIKRERFLRDRINAIAYKIEKTPMTAEQRQVFLRPTMDAWAKLILGFSCDQLDASLLLFEFEHYENTAGGHSGRALQQSALRMATSRCDACRLLGRAIDVVYDNPNVKAYVSEALINRLLPIRDPEFSTVQDVVLNNPVVGNRRVDTQVSIKLQPDPEKLAMNLNVTGRVVASTSSAVFSARLHNQSYANYFAQKRIEWHDDGVKYWPAVVNAESVNRLNTVETDVDFVPLVGDMAREITRSQFEARQAEIQEETREKVIRETKARFDHEANERFDAVNARLRANFFRNLANLGLSLTTQRSRTTAEWLLASLRLGNDSSLGCQTTEPPTLPGAFADFKLHESSVNAFLTQLELTGRAETPRETLAYLATKLNRPKLLEIELEENDFSYVFAQKDPISVRFLEDRIRLDLRFERIQLGKQTWEDVETRVYYRPSVTSDGKSTFTRDGIVEIYGAGSLRELFPLRAVFAKVFSAQKSFELKPELFESDDRFAGLSLSLCRISRGWFAISIVKEPSWTRESLLPRMRQ
ncbi:MAG: hypothetical protein Q4G03_04910 [Planctomycetia bacterium]|nr:hypothetical protein [Planctomycetia bacterium]